MKVSADTQVAERWVECQAKDRQEVRHILGTAHEAGAIHMHTFWYEPWYPEGAVVRVHLPVDAEFDIPCIPWDPAPDAELFGEGWPFVQEFLEASTVLGSMKAHSSMHSKLVHCFLNAQGYDVHQEFAWALRFAYGRARMCWMDRRRLVGRFFRR